MPGFGEILGHDQIKEHFRRAIETEKVSHAYILSGESGMGKKTLAKVFSLTLLCESGKSDPCMNCHSCRQVLSNNHPDLIYVTHEKPSSIGVDDIRKQINDTIWIRPYIGRYKIYIVDEAEKMTVQAQNALLKTIEEPPFYGMILLLTTSQEIFLPTILSRCVQMKLKPLQDSSVKKLSYGKAGHRGRKGRYIYGICQGEFRKRNFDCLLRGFSGNVSGKAGKRRAGRRNCQKRRLGRFRLGRHNARRA